MDKIRAWLFILERMLHLQTDQVTAIAERDHSPDRKFSTQARKKLCARSRVSHHERACGTHVHDIVIAESFGEDTWAQYPVPTNVYSPEQNDRSHRCVVMLTSIAPPPSGVQRPCGDRENKSRSVGRWRELWISINTKCGACGYKLRKSVHFLVKGYAG